MRLAAIGSFALLACSSPSEHAASTSQAVVNGTTSTTSQNYVVQIAIKKPTMIPYCTGTMIAKNLVITARHCVGELDAEEIKVTDFAPSKLAIYTGVDAGPKTLRAQPEANGARLFTDGTNEVALDIAVIMLDRELELPIVPIRLQTRALKGEVIDVIGYGLTEDGYYPQHRQQRSGLKIAYVGPGHSTLFDLGRGEFQMGEAACAGDSGGPALAQETGALVGIASRVSNGTERTETKPAAFCIGKATEDIYTDLTPAKDFITAAFEAAGAEPWIEGEPSPEEKAKAAADAAAAEEAARQKKAKEDEGCSTAPGSSSGSEIVVVFAVALAFGRRRRSGRG
jgi:MYXO-CTERM domain-containing protein